MPSQHAWWTCESPACYAVLPSCSLLIAELPQQPFTGALSWMMQWSIQHCHACSLKRVHGKCPKELKDQYECLDYYR